MTQPINFSKVTDSLSIFHEKFEKGDHVELKTTGIWKRENLFLRFIRWIFRLHDRRVIKTARAFTQFLDKLEKMPVHFDNKDPTEQKFYTQCLKTAKLLKAKVKRPKALSGLEWRVTGLKYRLEKENGGLNPDESCSSDELLALAKEWKNKEVLYDDKELANWEVEKIKEAAKYPKFVNVLKKTPFFQTLFFKWALRDGNNVRAFIEYPATYQRLKECLLAGRIGRFAKGAMLRIEKQENEKVITLPFEGKKVNLLDESQTITLSNEWKLTVKAALDVFKDKNKRTGNLEFFDKEGIVNWNAHFYGRWDPKTKKHSQISINQEKWWEKFPVFEELSLEEVQKRYGAKLEAGQWLGLAQASCMKEKNVDDAHGYEGVLIPNEGGKTYRLMEFGKFAEGFPSNILQTLFFLGATRKSRISYPDENGFYSHRKRAFWPKALTPKEGTKLMNKIGSELIKALEGNLVFQFSGENCAYWPQMLNEDLFAPVPNFFRVDGLKAKPENPVLKRMFRHFKKHPKRKEFHLKLLKALFCGCRSKKVVENGKKVKKSIFRSEFGTKNLIYLPGMLHHQILKGTIKEGKVYTGQLYTD